MIDTPSGAGDKAVCDSCEDAHRQLRAIDHYVPYISTVPVIAGQNVQIFVHEKAPAEGEMQEKVPILMVHGGVCHGQLAFDLPYKTYSWMSDLAHAGFDVFAMDMTGYGKSARPTMSDPYNVDPRQRSIILPEAAAHADAPYPFQLCTIQSECDEIDRVVDYIREIRGVDKVNLVGWSGGGARTGFYTSRRPSKVGKLVILAASNFVGNGPDEPPADMPAPGFPMVIQSRHIAEAERWNPFIRAEGQLEAGMQEIVWKACMDSDPLGASWGPGVMRAPTRTYWGWNNHAAAAIVAPTLIMVGEFDALLKANHELYAHLGATNKVFLNIACGSHFVVWEKQHGTVHKFCREWLVSGSCGGNIAGAFTADTNGHII